MALAGVTKFIPNPAGILMLAKSPLVMAALSSAADQIAESAKDHAPEDTGDYIDGIEVWEGEIPGTLAVVATDFKSYWIEVGTEHTPAFAPLRIGAEAAGFTLVSGGGED